jgi:hypothetical protein
MTWSLGLARRRERIRHAEEQLAESQERGREAREIGQALRDERRRNQLAPRIAQALQPRTGHNGTH